MVASVLTAALLHLWGPGLVLLALCGWLVRRALRAARNESILEEQPLRDAFGQVGMGDDTAPTATPTPTPTPTPTSPPTSTSPPPHRAPPQLFRADVRG